MTTDTQDTGSHDMGRQDTGKALSGREGAEGYTLRVNGSEVRVAARPSKSLLDVLHDDLGLGEVRYGCGEGVCGTCTVLVDGEAVSACLMFVPQAEGREITTLSGLAALGEDTKATQVHGRARALHPLQQSFLRNGALQCGFCTPGMILAAHALVERVGRPTREEVAYELVGNLCRCTGYAKIFEAVAEYAGAAAEGTRPLGVEPAGDHGSVAS